MLPYLLASLPAARLGVTPEIEIETFLDTCRRFSGEARSRELAAAVRQASGASARPAADANDDERAGRPDPRRGARPSAAARAWAQAEARIDDEVVHRRCARDRRDPRPYLHGPPGPRLELAEAVAAAFEAPHPGVRERRLDELRWRLADELAARSPVGFEALYARAVQLGIAWRWARWDGDAGWAVLEAHLRRIEQGEPDRPGGPRDG